LNTRRRIAINLEPARSWEASNGNRLAGDEWGNPGEPVVLLMHGGGQTRHAWKQLGEVLAREGYRAISFDARGHGDSDWAPDGDYRTEAMVQDLVSIVEATGDPHPVLVGASMGGEVGLIGIAEGHVSSRALVLVDIVPRIEWAGVQRIAEFMQHPLDGFGSLDEVAALIAAYQPHRPPSRNLRGLAKNVRVDDNGRYHWHWDPAYRPITSEAVLQTRQRRLEDCAKKITIPTLLVRGGLSDIVSDEGVQEFLQLCRHTEYVNVPSARHMVVGDDNDVFANAIVDFLSRALGGENEVPAR
jgi:pimeloyl-ACP methyl ester carboxylesterase